VSTDDITARRHGANPQSAAAHGSIIADKARLLRLVVAQVAQRGYVGATSDELEAALGLPHQTVSARLSEAKRAGWVVDTGRRRPTRSGRAAAVFVATTPNDLRGAA
jgi:hypothetical protein